MLTLRRHRRTRTRVLRQAHRERMRLTNLIRRTGRDHDPRTRPRLQRVNAVTRLLVTSLAMQRHAADLEIGTRPDLRDPRGRGSDDGRAGARPAQGLAAVRTNERPRAGHDL